ncbi:hypothetical protein P7K49_012599 [Saguinus oedipus]|uniref:Uncharacterized protein n=1 Tax=Saguinus oedipus TaxID=9490 RepID=A0ABQ9VDK7_SAGOE|nr:hypothetical protein P7K49_012599 [Saguinus oedipus]
MAHQNDAFSYIQDHSHPSLTCTPAQPQLIILSQITQPENSCRTRTSEQSSSGCTTLALPLPGMAPEIRESQLGAQITRGDPILAITECIEVLYAEKMCSACHEAQIKRKPQDLMFYRLLCDWNQTQNNPFTFCSHFFWDMVLLDVFI